MHMKNTIYKFLRKTEKNFFYPSLLKDDLIIFGDYLRTINRVGRVTQLVPSGDGVKNALIISMTNNIFLAKAHAMLAFGLREKGYRPYILSLSSSRWAQRYFSIFGLRDLIYWDKCVDEFSPSSDEAELMVDGFLASSPAIQDFKTWQFHGVYVGKLALSTMIRRELQGQFELDNPAQATILRRWLVDTVKSVLVAEKIFQKTPFEKIVARDAGYAPNGAVYEVGLNFGVDAIRFESAQMMGQWMVKRYNADTRGQALFSLSSDTWQVLRDISLSQEQDTALSDDFAERYNPNSNRDLYQYQVGKKHLSDEDVRRELQLDPGKKTAVVFAHISWDANFFDGDDLFDDFEHWLVETVRIACDNPHLNWVIKLHPANVYKLRREGKEFSEEAEMVALRRIGELPTHIKIMHADTPINTWALFPVIDYGLTVRGTIGMELPCFGIPTVIAGTGRYNGYGFTIDPATRAEYRELLLNLHNVPRLDSHTVELARRHAYWVFLHRQASFDEFSKMTTQVMKDPNHPLHHNLELRKISLADAPRFSTFLDWLLSGSSPDFVMPAS